MLRKVWRTHRVGLDALEETLNREASIGWEIFSISICQDIAHVVMCHDSMEENRLITGGGKANGEEEGTAARSAKPAEKGKPRNNPTPKQRSGRGGKRPPNPTKAK